MIELCQLDKAAEISRLAVLDRYRSNDSVFISNGIIGAMCGAKRYEEAIALFHYFFNESNVVPNMVSFNHIIKAHFEENRVEEALQLFHHANNRGFDPDHETYRILTKGLVNAGRVHDAVGIVDGADHLLCDSTVYSYLIRGFLDQGNHDKADQLFNRMSEELYDYDDIALVDATFVDYWFRQGNDEKAMEIYNNKDGEKFMSATTGNTLLKILLDNGKKSEAWELFDEMINNTTYDGLLGAKRRTFDSETFNIMVNECFKLGNFTKAMETFVLGASFGASGYSNIIERFCERGMMSEAEGLFEEMCSRKDMVLSSEIPILRSMIKGFVKVGRVDDAQLMLKKMVDASVLKVAIHKAD
ncbi:PREDICTED: pentatricopeptide repeat-containing protein At1g10270-like [Camelina sativa]|uniref:Pentatricopeptide repeat-containing protein At1g10270-like n=1 Tax=Camelina sativa TaxID=90675 RepID=A0ABM1RSJ5_CAMSA|nr:PREDICTED: pentatricopeptide repeat-containing protein At1g10270-like [Camelina sativa]